MVYQQNVGSFMVMILTPEKLLDLVDKLKPGQREIYFKGSFLLDPSRKKRALALTARMLQDEGVVFLGARTIKDFETHYYIIKAKNGIITPRFRYSIEKMYERIE